MTYLKANSTGGTGPSRFVIAIARPAKQNTTVYTTTSLLQSENMQCSFEHAGRGNEILFEPI
jgi:hypothetical protein